MTDTLKSICDQCTHLRNPHFDFIPSNSTRHREILVRDLQELLSAAAAENEKTVVILAGSILEGVLYSLIQGQSGYISQRRGTFEFNPDHSLQNYLSIFNKWLNHLTPSVVLPDSVVYYRDLVHINHEINSPHGVCAGASREMLRILDALLGGLSELTIPLSPGTSPGT
jgi:hypothetical protein